MHQKISHNVPFCNRNVHTCAHFCYKMVHCGICVAALWDLCNRSIIAFVRGITSHRWILHGGFHNFKCSRCSVTYKTWYWARTSTGTNAISLSQHQSVMFGVQPRYSNGIQSLHMPPLINRYIAQFLLTSRMGESHQAGPRLGRDRWYWSQGITLTG